MVYDIIRWMPFIAIFRQDKRSATMRLAIVLTTLFVFLPSLSFAGPSVNHVMAKNITAQQYNDKKSGYENRCKAICSTHQRFFNRDMRTKCTGSKAFFRNNAAVCNTAFATKNDEFTAKFQQQWRENRWKQYVVLDWSRMPGKKTGDYKRSKVVQSNSPETCLRGCLGDSMCQAVEFSQKKCFYKTSTDATLVRYNGSHKVKNGQYQFTSRTIFKVTGVERRRFEKLNSTAKNGVDRFGKDFKSINGISWDGCRFACARLKQCMSITYRNKDRKCWLKNGVPATKSAKGIKSAVVQ